MYNKACLLSPGIKNSLISFLHPDIHEEPEAKSQTQLVGKNGTLIS